MMKTETIQITHELLALLSEIDEFKGAWRALGTLAPDRLKALRRIATIESIGSSTRIEGNKLSDREVEHLLGKLEIKKFETRDEQEVAGYAEAMETIFQAWQDIPITENHIKQLHRDLLRYSEKDERHRGEYKTLRNDVGAFDADGKMIGIVFETATPFDTPRRMTELVTWLRDARELKAHSPLADDCRVRCSVPGNPPLPGRKWPPEPRSHDLALIAGRICLCAVFVARKRD
jgi:Fic family protein